MNGKPSDLGLRARTGVLIVLGILGTIAAGPWTFSFFALALWLIGSREAHALIVQAGERERIGITSVLLSGLWAISMAGLWAIGWGNGAYTLWLPMGWFVLIWLNDTGAYLVGRKLGRHPLAPRISPKKTWEGWFGGLLGSVMAALLLRLWMPIEAPWVLLAVVASVFGPLGDLAESALKRRAGAKDSGTILPGHGGVLDRFDSHIFAAPIAAILLHFF